MNTNSSPKPKLSMVMAMDKNRLIGKDNAMPWHIPGEQAYFKKITLGKPVVMGRKTHESIGRPLPGRQNIVITRNPEWKSEGVDVVTSVEAAIDLAKQADPVPAEIMVIGGAAICELAMAKTDRLYLTVIDQRYKGDTWLNSYVPDQWQETSRQDHPASGDVPAFSYLVLERL